LSSGQDDISLDEEEHLHLTRAHANIVYEIERSDWIRLVEPLYITDSPGLGRNAACDRKAE